MGVHNLSFYPLQCEGHCAKNSQLLDISSIMGISHIYSIDYLKSADRGLQDQMFPIVIASSCIN